VSPNAQAKEWREEDTKEINTFSALLELQGISQKPKI
jgi:hypothetical protein